jgi:hypothetical protein
MTTVRRALNENVGMGRWAVGTNEAWERVFIWWLQSQSNGQCNEGKVGGVRSERIYLQTVVSLLATV